MVLFPGRLMLLLQSSLITLHLLCWRIYSTYKLSVRRFCSFYLYWVVQYKPYFWLSAWLYALCVDTINDRTIKTKNFKQALPSQEENNRTLTKMTTLPVNGTSPSNLMSKQTPRKEFGRASGCIHKSMVSVILHEHMSNFPALCVQ